MDNNTHRPGVRERVYQPNMIWPWVFRQAEVWVDPYGSEHEIALMPLGELECAIKFCYFEAERIRNLCYVEWIGRGFDLKLNGVRLDLALTLAGPKPDTAGDPREWIEATPVLGALRRRLDELAS